MPHFESISTGSIRPVVFFTVFLGLLLCTVPVMAGDSTFVFWVFFKDKGIVTSQDWEASLQKISVKAKIRRQGKIDSTDLPVYQAYLDSVKNLGIFIKNISKWLNAASIVATHSQVQELQGRSFVRSIRYIGHYSRKVVQPIQIPKRKIQPGIPSTYGSVYPSMDLIGVPFMHDYLLQETGESPGKGIRIALFDSGFRISHPCLTHLQDSNLVVADSDFVAHDSNVDYEAGDSSDISEHGTAVLSLLAGYVPDTLIGAAYAAEYLLARTEETGEEHHTEEDNWVAALEWAEAMGADLVSSSLGYRYDFNAPDTDYTFSDMDGQTAIVSKAATIAVQNGMLIVNAMGNEGPSAQTINAPADVDGVLSVGAVDDNGTLAGFSSRGPTASGWIKPDVVAPGVLVSHAQFDGGYQQGNGTSFSTPLCAGCAALIKQLHPDWSNTAVISRLRICADRTGISETLPNNNYGWGIVNAMAAELGSSSLYGGIFDSTGYTPIQGAQILRTDAADTSISLSSGLYYFRLVPASSNLRLIAYKPGWASTSMQVANATGSPIRKDFRLDRDTDTTVVWGLVEDSSGTPLDSVQVRWQGPTNGLTSTDRFGRFLIEDVQQGTYVVVLQRNNYVSIQDTIYTPTDSVLKWQMQKDLNKVAGAIINSDSAGLDSVLLTWQGPTQGQSTTNHYGWFLVEGLKEGHYQFDLTKRGYRKASTTVDVPADSLILWMIHPIPFGGISVYPIPCQNGNLTFEFTADSLFQDQKFRTLYIDLYTLDGYRVKSLEPFDISDGENVRTTLDVSKYSSGIYYAYMRFGNEKRKMKISIINR